MKRHKSIIPLSREHHKVLVLAQLLKNEGPDYKNLPADPEGKAKYAKEIFDNIIAGHARKEEQILFPIARGMDKETRELVQVLIGEHKMIRELVVQLQKEPDEEVMDKLGKLLEDHVRKEERILFEKVQSHLTEEELESMGKELA